MYNEMVFKHKNTSCTSSRLVAKCFGKDHKNVIRSIRNLECSEEFKQLNFEQLEFEYVLGSGGINKGTEYIMTKNGFVFLVMGFTGREAAKFKEAYIGAFDAMEAELTRQKGAALMYATAELIDQIDKAAMKVGSLTKLGKRIGVSAATLCVLKNSLVKPRPGHFFSQDMIIRIESQIDRVLNGPDGYKTELADIVLDISNKRARSLIMEYLKKEAII